ncbi:NmrA family NAD(P)-binding protein [Labrenzia sp. PHM005]|uniref:NmrA family NAD(P)-binding protein n=1 Tax=Labrenzia sp. PHM005 TaxID=2590016 RepID=UPI00114026D5|nr:NmrA family NAD(P)-binding protein [Labrenzia sp. PHM005]QDG75814.1 NmrA family transcriptional regulator [Labrenzia sp. PHM005]
MSTLPNILVTSAAGKTGLPLTLQLLEKAFPVRAFVRKRDNRSDLLAKAGAEIIVGDQYALSDMRKAMAGMQRAYQCAPTAPNGLHYNAVFTVAAVEAQLEHVVTLGQWLSAADHPSLFTREIYLSDTLIRMPSGMTVTSVNPGWFADNYLMVLDMAAHLGLFAMPLGEGSVKKNAPPSNEDIASVAAAALIDPTSHAGKTYRPTGPELLSPNDIAAAMGRALGRKVSYMDISEKMMTKALRAHPPSNYSEAAVSQLAIYAEEYRRGAFAVTAPTDHVAKVGGRLPETFESIVRRTIAERPDLKARFSKRIGALAGFAKMLLTPALDLDEIQRERDYVRIAQPQFCQDTPEWQETHSSAALRTPLRQAS